MSHIHAASITRPISLKYENNSTEEEDKNIHEISEKIYEEYSSKVKISFVIFSNNIVIVQIENGRGDDELQNHCKFYTFSRFFYFCANFSYDFL